MERSNSVDGITQMNDKMEPALSPKASNPLKKGVRNGDLDNNTQIAIPAVPKENEGFFQYLRTLTIEPVVFLYLFGFVMELACLSNMMMDKGCLYHYQYGEEICKNMSHYKVEKEQLEILANNYSLYINLLGLVNAFTMIFIAPWSDKYGRKLPLFVGCFGTLLADLGFVLCTLRFESPLFYLIIAKIPNEICGGLICVLTIVCSHASEVSSEKTRTRKFTTIEIATGLSLSLGAFAGGALERYYGYLTVFTTATAMHCVCLIWIYFCVPETKGLDAKVPWCEKIRDFFKTENLTKGWKASLRQRKNKGRILLMLFFMSMCFIVLTYESFTSIGFTYAHNLYNWDPMAYNSVNTIFSITQMVILVICMPLLFRIYRVTDNTLGIIGSASLIGKFFILAFSDLSVYVFYLGNAMGCLSGLCQLAVRSGISKLVDEDELGRVFSFLATCEAIFPLFGTLVFTKVFNATIQIHPSITYLMTAASLLLPLGTFAWAYLHAAKNRQYARMKTDGEIIGSKIALVHSEKQNYGLKNTETIS